MAMFVNRAFFDEIVQLHGMPSSIVSDRDDVVFTGTFRQELFRLARVGLHMRSAYHQQSDSQLEAANKVTAMYLRCLLGDRPKQWIRWLPWVQCCYNASYHSALRATPFKVVYGCDPPSLRSSERGDSRVPAMDQALHDRDVFLVEVRQHLLEAREFAKSYYDPLHHEIEFVVGDCVWLRLLHRSSLYLRCPCWQTQSTVLRSL